MPTYKLYYFNGRGRAELARIIMHYAGVEFEDIRFGQDQWPEYKEKMPFGQVPVLEVDGKMIAQSNTICRYLARKHGLAGKDEIEIARAEAYVDCMSDVMNAAAAAYMESDPEKKKELFQHFITAKVVPHVQMIEKHLKKNGSGYLVGTALTWADLAHFSFITGVLAMAPEILKDMPHLKRLLSTIENIPKVKNWIEIRPVTPM